MKRTEGYVSFRGLRTWYRVVGENDDEGKHPVVALHGGPGATHDYIESLEGLAEVGRRVVFTISSAAAARTAATSRCGRSRPTWTRWAPCVTSSVSTRFTSSATRGAACSRWSTH